jgi:SdrD B-like domain
MEMSQEVARTTLQDQAQQLMDGPLKHVRAAALAAALVPLASVFAAPASAQAICQSGGICGTVFTDTNNNGALDAGETGLANLEVDALCTLCNPLTDTITVFTDSSGNYAFVPDKLDNTVTYTVSVGIPTGTQPSQTGPDNVGTSNGAGSSSVSQVSAGSLGISFGFHPSTALNPGTGTPGYWKNHPNAWPVTTMTVGGVTYTKAKAIELLGNVGKDKTTTMFASLVPAKLNVLIGNDGSCVSVAIDAGDAWMASYGPVGTGVAGGSAAWQIGDPIHNTLDAYNNGLLCAPHRN